jgi:hypothetical protein
VKREKLGIVILGDLNLEPLLQMNEANLLKTKSVGELIHLLQDATRHTYDRDELLKVSHVDQLGPLDA